MSVIRIILTVLFIIDCIGLTIIVLMQEGKSAGLGAISGAAESYWGKNKGRSMEGALVKITRVMAVLFMVLAVVLNINKFTKALFFKSAFLLYRKFLWNPLYSKSKQACIDAHLAEWKIMLRIRSSAKVCGWRTPYLQTVFK